MIDLSILGIPIRRRIREVADEDVAAVRAALDHLRRRFDFRTVRAIKKRVIPLPVIAEHWRSGRLDQLCAWRRPRKLRYRAAPKSRRPR